MVPFNLDHVLASLPVQELMNRRRSGAATATRGGDDVRVEYDARLDHPEAVPFRGEREGCLRNESLPSCGLFKAVDLRHLLRTWKWHTTRDMEEFEHDTRRLEKQ